ncbi:MAG: glycosyltransferase, partial [Phycisphaeraceae bacterium]
MAETPPETRPEMRPVIAHALHRLDRAGAEVLAAGLARDLRDRFRFVFLCLDGLGAIGEALRDEGFVVETLERRPGIDRALAKRLRQRLRHHRVDLVHAHQYTPFFYAALARGAMPIGNKHPPILFTEHGRHVPDRRSTKRVFANKLLLRPADRVTAVGRFVKQALVENEGIPDRRVDVVYNGIAPGPPPTDDDRRQARERLGLDADRSLVVHVARFHPVKDHATAIRAWAKLHNDLPEALLVLVGDGEPLPQGALHRSQPHDLGLGGTRVLVGPLETVHEVAVV